MISLSIALAVSAFGLQQSERTEDQCLVDHPEISSPVEVAACISDLTDSEQSMMQAYAALHGKTGSSDLPFLEADQRTWVAYRDAECPFEAGGNPGSTGWSSDVISCTADRNRERIQYLKARLADR